MKVQHLTEKGSGTINEDSYFVSDNNFGVFDGATGLIKYFDANGNTGALIASQTAKEVFEKNQNKPLLISTQEVTAKIREKEEKAEVNLNDKACLWSTTASVVRINEKTIEYLAIGDSPIIFIDKDNNFKTFFVDHDHETVLLWEKLVQEGVRDLKHDKRTMEQLTKNRRETNIIYGVFNGEKEALRFVQTGSLSRENIKHILIFSDGMLIPKEKSDDPEDFKTIVKLFKEGGLQKVKSYVRNLENSDPQCLKYVRFKRHDDLTAIAITL